MAKFVAPSKNLRLVIKPESRQVVDGIVQQIPGKAIKFSNGQYETIDKDELAFLRNHSVYNKDFFEKKVVGISPSASDAVELPFDDIVEEKTEFECDVCGMVCNSAAGLSSHKRSAHKEEGE